MTAAPAATPRIAVASLSTAAQALLARSQTVARIIADAHIGSPEALRATAARYAAAAEELHATGHEDVACLLDVFGQTALRNARLIEAGFRTPRRPHWLKLVSDEATR